LLKEDTASQETDQDPRIANSTVASSTTGVVIAFSYVSGLPVTSNATSYTSALYELQNSARRFLSRGIYGICWPERLAALQESITRINVAVCAYAVKLQVSKDLPGYTIVL
jgi:hypothetical protein